MLWRSMATRVSFYYQCQRAALIRCWEIFCTIKLLELAMLVEDRQNFLEYSDAFYPYTGKFIEARAMAERAQAILSKSYGGAHTSTTAAVFVKAEVLRVSGRCKESAVLIEQTLVSRRRRYGDSHPLVADCLLSFGISMMYTARYQEADTKFKLALVMRQKYFSEPVATGKRGMEKVDLRVAEVMYWQGVLFHFTGHFEDSIQLLEKTLQAQLTAVELTETDLDKTFPSVAKTLHRQRSSSSTKKPIGVGSASINKPVMMLSDSFLALGKVYQDIGRWDKAETFFNRALDIRVGINPGEDLNHYKILECQLALAQLNRLRGIYKVDVSLVQLLSNDGLRNSLGRENPLYFACQLELAGYYFNFYVLL